MTPDELATWLATNLAPPGNVAADRLSTALAPLADAGRMRGFLHAALRDGRWLDAALRTSYRHPNGFDKIVLLSTGDYQLRLHVWGEADRGATVENVHNHRWHFASTIIEGGYRFQEFAPSTAGQEFHAYGYAAERGASAYSLEPLGRRSLSCTFDAHLEAGTSYTLTPDVFHRVAARPGRLTASLMLQGPRRRSPVLVFAKDRLTPGPTLPLDRFSREALCDRLETLLEALGRPRSG